MPAKCRETFAAVAVAILAVAMAMGSTDATIPLTSWAGPGCSGQTAPVYYCGCSNLKFYGGQDIAQGQTATFYNETGCAGTSFQVSGGFVGTRWCGDFGWRSINIDC